MGGALTCNDCICEVQDCVFIRVDEQPYFQAYRLANRIGGDRWRGYEFVLWISQQWRAFGKQFGVTENQRSQSADQFREWLFVRVGHPAASTRGVGV